ncbi:hypothetical protein QAD02_011125 [Eretmocerus hayati]|uniref:Uncharacterized protein n=1 Tax=Eretmocerus hayati TaxID=131215 RepID=A0ACC2NVP4_9HYME|nr:hypothetical protein QAD02_011125 [Eretmocerus hayati]
MSDSEKSNKSVPTAVTGENADEGNSTPASVSGPGRGGGRGRGRPRKQAVNMGDRPMTRSNPAISDQAGEDSQLNRETVQPDPANPQSALRIRISAEEVLDNSTQSSGDSSVPDRVLEIHSAPSSLPGDGRPRDKRFPFPGFRDNQSQINTEDAHARVQTDTPGILLGIKNRQQAFQSKLDAHAVTIAKIERVSAKLEKVWIDTNNALKGQNRRLEVAEGHIRYVSEVAASVGSQVENLNQRVQQNSTEIQELTTLVDGCSSVFTASSERCSTIEGELERAKKDIKEIQRKGGGGNCSRPSIYPKVKLDIPTFGAEAFEKPARFMDDLRVLAGHKHKSWANWVPFVQDCLNEVYQDTIEATPLEIHLNKTPTRFWKKWINPPERKDIPYEQKLVWVHERISKEGERRALALNEKNTITEFHEGQEVLVRACNVSSADKGISSKLLALYEGPYIIRKIIGRSTFRLFDNENNIDRGMFHGSSLRPYFRPQVKAVESSSADE